MAKKVGKRLQKAVEMVEAGRQYEVAEAVELLCQLPKAKFDETVDVAVTLGVNPRKAEENVRGTVALPHGTGKTLRVAAFCKGDKAKEAEAAGADFVGAEDLVKKIQDGWLDFDAAVATPDVMAQVGRIGKLLGPRGLMPNPKVGTVTFDIGKAVEAIKAGRVEFRVEKAGIVHVGVAKVSFGPEKIADNVLSVIDAIVKAKPSTAKGTYLKGIYLSTTMGPGLELNPIPFRG
ncbi:MAG: 50S ribosomal protein L1 [Bdellovibrionales bacterium]|nr:50S ribosomal protein L1 [Bdellovibrionales bacterium]